MIARIEQAASGSGAPISFKKVDLGHGHDGLIAIVQVGGAPIKTGSIDLFLPPDRYAAIALLLPGNADAETITLNVGKAFSAVSDKLPAAPRR